MPGGWNRKHKHVVNWQTDDKICNKHFDALPYSHPLMSVKMHLFWMQKRLQKCFKGDPDQFKVVDIQTMREAPMGLSRYETCMPVQFIDLIHWAKLRDFDQEMDQTNYRFNEHLLSLAKFLNREDSKVKVHGNKEL